MVKDWKETKSYTQTSKEIERLLADDFGDKLQPVNRAKLDEQRRQRARQQGNK